MTTNRAIGAMKMPVGFKYEKVHLLGRPRHQKYSDFWRRHIPMDHTHRAKQFAPFDALDGFDEAIARKEILYVEHNRMDENELNRKLNRLQSYHKAVKIRYFVPCTVEDNEASDPLRRGYEIFSDGVTATSMASDPIRGRYEIASGAVCRINPETETLRINGLTIRFDEINDIEFQQESVT